MATAKKQAKPRQRHQPSLVDWYAAQAPTAIPEWYIRLYGRSEPEEPAKTLEDFIPKNKLADHNKWRGEFHALLWKSGVPAEVVKVAETAMAKLSQHLEERQAEVERREQELYFSWRVHYGLMMYQTRHSKLDDLTEDSDATS